MTFVFLGPDPVEEAVRNALELFQNGVTPAEIESEQVDFKEEPGRRSRSGEITPALQHNEEAAKYLRNEMACMANTLGGGAVILGISDTGERIGTSLDAQWLRHRIFELTEKKLTCRIEEVDLQGCRLLVLFAAESLEPIASDDRKYYWRVADNCVEVDSTSWRSAQLQKLGFDWSALPSGHTAKDIPATAFVTARELIAGIRPEHDLSEASDADLLRRLNLIAASTPDTLTNAGSLLFVATPGEGIDYIRRSKPGGDSTYRIRSKKPLIEQISEVLKTIGFTNPTTHHGDIVRRQINAIPPTAAREVIVNAVAHRNWNTDQPVLVEHVENTLIVTSPGGFPAPVNTENIITHPSVPRHRSLAEAMAAMGIAEREGVGIDRVVTSMLLLGHPVPEISEIAGPSVRVGLFGGEADGEVVDFYSQIDPRVQLSDVDLVLVIDNLCSEIFIDADSAVSLLQRPAAEAQRVLQRCSQSRFGSRSRFGGEYVLVEIEGTSALGTPAFRLSDQTRELLSSRSKHELSIEGRRELALKWARHRGRISSSELAELAAVSVPTAGRTLSELGDDGLLMPSRKTKGRGFHYLPA